MKRRSIKSLERDKPQIHSSRPIKERYRKYQIQWSLERFRWNMPNLILFWTLITKFITVKFGRFKKFVYLCRVIQNGAWRSGSHMRFWLL